MGRCGIQHHPKARAPGLLDRLDYSRQWHLQLYKQNACYLEERTGSPHIRYAKTVVAARPRKGLLLAAASDLYNGSSRGRLVIPHEAPQVHSFRLQNSLQTVSRFILADAAHQGSSCSQAGGPYGSVGPFAARPNHKAIAYYRCTGTGQFAGAADIVERNATYYQHVYDSGIDLCHSTDTNKLVGCYHYRPPAPLAPLRCYSRRKGYW